MASLTVAAAYGAACRSGLIDNVLIRYDDDNVAIEDNTFTGYVAVGAAQTACGWH